MSSLLPLPSQRSAQPAARSLNVEAKIALQPLHDDLASESSAFDGIVYFSKDKWHPNNASAVVAVQPPVDGSDRFEFYRKNIERHRVDLGATALGIALTAKEVGYIRSKMNPFNHTTLAAPSIIDGTVVGALQGAWNDHYGRLPSEKRVVDIWRRHETTIRDVAHDFNVLSKRVTSIGDTLELLAPATPNAYIISWDMSGSTKLAMSDQYGALRNYLLDAKGLFNNLTGPYKGSYHDTGDGQDMIVWLPEHIDRSDVSAIRAFGQQDILPIVTQMNQEHAILAEKYSDIQPMIRLIVGLGYVERDTYDELTSAEYWEIADLIEQKPVRSVRYTKAARTVLEQ